MMSGESAEGEAELERCARNTAARPPAAAGAAAWPPPLPGAGRSGCACGSGARRGCAPARSLSWQRLSVSRHSTTRGLQL